METKRLKRFAQYARRNLLEQVAAKLGFVLAEESRARRENEKAVSRLAEAVRQQGKAQVVERVAYIWFNRFCALRFMDVNRYSRIGVISPTAGQFQPEILAEAKMGHIDEVMVHDKTRQQVFDLLDGKAPSHDPQTEAYRLLVVAICNYWHRAMPFLFERIDDYTELLMPDDLLSGNSILAYTREAMTPDVCEDVEVIGWLYQFYISEKKDEVFAGLKKKKKISPENIPAATQLFTPHWIVRYLVENSLGRLWMLNRPNSSLAAEHMEYYIRPEQPETDFLRINSPEEIKICDPACGSGHMLTYAFDLLHAIYEEEGYEPNEIPEKILTHNLFGIEIDERAGELAAFALTMKARARQRRFFRKKIAPNICVLENITFDETELTNYMDFVGRDLFTVPLQSTLRQFEEADNFGSLIRPELTDVGFIRQLIKDKGVLGQLFLTLPHQKVLQVLKQADYLSPKYHVVLANPPYMGGKGMNGRLKSFAQDNYKSSKSDLFAMFMERNLDLARQKGSVAMITMQSWMFLSSFEKLRYALLGEGTLLSMAHFGARAFDSIGGEVVSTTAFVLENAHKPDYKGGYIRLVDGNSETEKEEALREAVNNPDRGWFYRACALDFTKIPGSTIAYWPNHRMRQSFNDHKSLSSIAKPKQGLATTDNDRFLRYWFECAFNNVCFFAQNSDDVINSGVTWFPCQKGGGFRKWFGNNEYVVNWQNNGAEIKKIVIERYGSASKRVVNEHLYFREGITWSSLSSSSLSMRYVSSGFIFETKGSMCFFESNSTLFISLGFCNSSIVNPLLQCISPTLDYHEGPIGKLPIAENIDKQVIKNTEIIIQHSKIDWDSYETSWDFSRLPLLQSDYSQPVLKTSFQNLRTNWQVTTLQMQQLEEENNRIFLEAYGLQDELDEKVPINEITLTCNPHYRYGNNKSEEELEALLLADTMREFISYAVGCMFGRYSLDKPGLILANQGETLADYLQHIPEPSFPVDDDNVIPLLNGDWFNDDITEHFRNFLRITFGEEHYEENLKFLEDALNIKNKRSFTIRDYFLKEFYGDHVKRYKKRPIYWLFSSPKGSFNALIYMHRYRPDTVSVVLNDYLREFRTKLVSEQDSLQRVEASADASKTEKTKALKQIEKLKKIIAELDNYERDTLYPLATQKQVINLDDGIKVNYKKFGKALKKVVGLS